MGSQHNYPGDQHIEIRPDRYQLDVANIRLFSPMEREIFLSTISEMLND